MEKIHINGIEINKGDAGFDAAIIATLFNKCDPNRRPDKMVVPKTVGDIQNALRFAKAHNKKVSVCSGGHSWSANHLRPDSVLINMTEFNQYAVDKDRMTATAGPGVGGSDLLKALFNQDLFFPAGHCTGVCIGGYLLQGGYAWNGSKLGMACESVLGLDMVTAEGELVHANKNENADLYWAARGSGAGFFGVVVRFHLKLYKRPTYCGMMSQIFMMKHLEDVYRWAYEVGPTIPKSVEFQMLMSRKTLKYFAAGIEAVAPIFAKTKDELHEAMAFMKNSPITQKAYVRFPFMELNIKTMYKFAMTHYPSDYYWNVDNMWTNASIEDLMPYLKDISKTLPPAPAHFLWLNWQPPKRSENMAYSVEDKIYLALYGAWASPNDTPQYENWATAHMTRMEHLATGIQLADENLHKRTAKFLSDENWEKLAEIRSQRDPTGLFNAWHNKISIENRVK